MTASHVSPKHPFLPERLSGGGAWSRDMKEQRMTFVSLSRLSFFMGRICRW